MKHLLTLTLTLAAMCVSAPAQVLRNTSSNGLIAVVKPQQFPIIAYYNMTDRASIHTNYRDGVDYVYQIDDKTGNGYNATQPDSSRQCYLDRDGYMICDSAHWLNVNLYNVKIRLFNSFALLDTAAYKIPHIVRPDSLASWVTYPTYQSNGTWYTWDFTSPQWWMYVRDMVEVHKIFEAETVQFESVKDSAFVRQYYKNLFNY